MAIESPSTATAAPVMIRRPASIVITVQLS